MRVRWRARHRPGRVRRRIACAPSPRSRGQGEHSTRVPEAEDEKTPFPKKASSQPISSNGGRVSTPPQGRLTSHWPVTSLPGVRKIEPAMLLMPAVLAKDPPMRTAPAERSGMSSVSPSSLSSTVPQDGWTPGFYQLSPVKCRSPVRPSWSTARGYRVQSKQGFGVGLAGPGYPGTTTMRWSVIAGEQRTNRDGYWPSGGTGRLVNAVSPPLEFDNTEPTAYARRRLTEPCARHAGSAVRSEPSRRISR